MRSIVILALLLSGCAAARADGPVAWDRPTNGPSGPRGGLQLPDGTVLGVRHLMRDGRKRFIVMRSDDVGRTWREHGTIASDTPDTDLGDGHLLQLRDGRLWCSFRRIKLPRSYAIEVAESTDAGATWRTHSVVDRSIVDTPSRHSRGLWASFLFQRSDGLVQCYYDDERSPFDAGRRGHQWVTVRAWDPDARAWVKPVVVSRAAGNELSRDGMPSVVELPGGRLLATVESVRADGSHPNLVRSVASDDGGATWNWPARGVVYQPAGEFMALAPWTIRTRGGTLVCVFCTDEDRDVPDVSGTPPRRLNMDLKYVISRDDGRTWSRAYTLYDAAHRNYLPGIIELMDGRLLAQWRNYSADGYTTRRGRVAEAGQ